MPQRKIPIEQIDQRARGAFVAGEPALWQSGRDQWTGTIDVEPLAPDAQHVTGIFSPAQTRFRFNGSDAYPSIEAIVEVRGGYPELTSITVINDATGGIVTANLRNISVASLIENVVMQTAARHTQVGEGSWRHDTVTEGDAEAVRNAPRRKRRARPTKAALEAEITRAAEVYRQSIGTGRPRQAVMEKLHLSERTATRRIEQARAAGLLPATTEGKARA